MSTDRTDQYPEVSAEDTGLVPPQSTAKSEWPKKIRTLTAAELDRLTIDALGRFYWDGKLVNYDAHPSRIEKPVDLDQHAMDLLDRTARELSDPNSVPDIVPEPEPVQLETPTFAATPTDAPAPVVASVPDAPAAAPVPAAAPIVEVRRQEVLVATPVQPETKRVRFTVLQSIGIFFARARPAGCCGRHRPVELRCRERMGLQGRLGEELLPGAAACSGSAAAARHRVLNGLALRQLVHRS